jgi:ATP-dependent Lon protease
MKNYPELEKEELFKHINKFEISKIQEVIEGKHYNKDYLSVFGEKNDNNLTNTLEENKLELELENIYNPYNQIEKSRDIEDLQYEKLNIFKYFSTYNNFIGAFVNKNISQNLQDSQDLQNSSNKNNKENVAVEYDTNEVDKIDTFIKCLCKIYVGHNIHQRINNEISKKTNLYILKGDYYFSLGYYTVSQIGNPLLIRFYSKIAENFAKVNFFRKFFNSKFFLFNFLFILF